MAPQIAPGSTFAAYRVEDEVGRRRGGMGVVYPATDLRLERPVALHRKLGMETYAAKAASAIRELVV